MSKEVRPFARPITRTTSALSRACATALLGGAILAGAAGGSGDPDGGLIWGGGSVQDGDPDGGLIWGGGSVQDGDPDGGLIWGGGSVQDGGLIWGAAATNLADSSSAV